MTPVARLATHPTVTVTVRENRTYALDQEKPPLTRMVWPFTHSPSDPARKETAAAMSAG